MIECDVKWQVRTDMSDWWHWALRDMIAVIIVNPSVHNVIELNWALQLQTHCVLVLV